MTEQNNLPNALLEGLNIFCGRYQPATEASVTDIFSTNEIQKIIRKVIGIDVSSQELSELLIQLQYNCVVEQGNCMWMVKSL